MSTKWDYKVVFVEGWERMSIEGHESRPEEGERNSAFARRTLNQLGAEGWELSGIQHAMPGRSYFVFKRPLAEGAEPDLSVVKRERRAPDPAPTEAGDSTQTASV
ncbi:MAG: hypothetical protein WCI67_07810 [Chloroflexales bacterium]